MYLYSVHLSRKLAKKESRSPPQRRKTGGREARLDLRVTTLRHKMSCHHRHRRLMSSRTERAARHRMSTGLSLRETAHGLSVEKVIYHCTLERAAASGSFVSISVGK
ncbi:hypothetical protein J6590_005575 [Homalodisca vitripennis]|nr:hypothetical protein J6590_005575 [Homalodisca vitripennis]